MMRKWALTTLVLFALLAPCAHAQVRAWLDRDRIEAGETTTLNIAADSAQGGPDYAPLERDFILSGHSSQRSARAENGRITVSAQYSVLLQPRREGVITIPSLHIGTQTTPPLALTVAPLSRTPTKAGDDTFIESEIDDGDPWVQQAVGLKVRLYTAVPLVSGALEQSEPEGATLRKVGQDVQYTQEMGGRHYNVIERRFLVIGERSGRVVLPGARFRGQGVGGFFDDLLGDGRRPLAADAPDRVLQVRAIPATAPQPWLPLTDLRLRYVTLPHAARAGESATVQIEAVADGAVAAQMPELQLASNGAAQVFPAALQADESFTEARPRTTLSRTFSIVPTRAGALRIEPPRLEWWDVRAGVARTATLPPIDLNVAPGTGVNAATRPDAGAPVDVADATQTGDGRIAIPGIQGRVLPWAAAAAAFALLWLFTLLWFLGHHPKHTPAPDAPDKPASPRPDLKRALADGDLGDIAETLCAAVQPPAADIDALRARIADTDQRAALDALQRARWAGGDPRAAREALRRAFARGVRVTATERTANLRDPLPPLYPPA
ncbi:BatD family protein [Lysobacter sp. 2RAF19]